MPAPSRRGSRGLGRLAALLGLVLALWIGQPVVAVALPLALLALLLPARNLWIPLGGAVLLGLALGGLGSGGGFWQMERGWLVLCGGWFAAMTLAWPARPFLPRALVALAGASVWTVGLLAATGSLERADAILRSRVMDSALVTRDLLLSLGSGSPDAGLVEALDRTVEAQVLLIPALVLLASLAGIAAAWWIYIRTSTGSGDALGRLQNFRFPEPLVWLLIGGLVLGLAFGWTGGWGRMGTNLTVFMGALYALRGFAVLLFLTGGLSWMGWGLVAVGFVLAAPFLLLAALVIGVADSWLDLRAQAAGAGGSGPDST